MIITINNTNYTKLKNLKFDPQADITGTEVIVNRFECEIITDNNISEADTAYLYDDLNNLWAKYWITKSERHGEAVKIIAQSALLLLNRITMPARFYSNTSLSSALSDIFAQISAIYGTSYTIDASLSSKTITGYAPEQSARDRFQWICFVVGAYVKTFFSDTVDLLAVDDTPSLIPLEKTFYKPKLVYGDVVTAIKVTAYSYTQGTPQTTDKWVEVNGTYYIETTQDFTLANPDVPATATDNIIEIKDVKLVNTVNVSEILTRLSTYYFQSLEVEADIINNGEFLPGKRFYLYSDVKSMVVGYLKSATFSFGLQARSSLKFAQSQTINGKELAIEYYYNDKTLYTSRFWLPVGYIYTIETKYVDYYEDGHRYIFYPLTDEITGTMPDADTVVRVECDIAIDFYEAICALYNVDDIDGEEVLKIG